MKRKFTLIASYGQQEIHDLAVTVAQAKALDKHADARSVLAAIIRANWRAIYEALKAFRCPGHDHTAIWPHEERKARLDDIGGGDCLLFTATHDGPQFSHEVEPAGRCFRIR